MRKLIGTLALALIAAVGYGVATSPALTGPNPVAPVVAALAPEPDCSASPLTVAEPRLMDHEGWLAACGTEAPGATPARITEDDPRWDCARHGNLVCGPRNGAPATGCDVAEAPAEIPACAALGYGYGD
jgi:hypothetical protein